MTYRQIYPTGRKHCSRCKCWRHLTDFGVRQWTDFNCAVPRTIASVCTPCGAARLRERTGYKPRQWYPNGAPGSAQYRTARQKKNRASQQRRREDPEYRELVNEYHRIWRNAKSGSMSRATGKRPLERVDSELFLEWLDSARNVNLTKSEDRRIRAARKGPEAGTISLGVVDSVLTRYGDQDQLAVLYPPE